MAKEKYESCLRQHREKLLLSQRELQALLHRHHLHTAHADIVRMEQGKQVPQPKTAKRIAKALGVPVDTVFVGLMHWWRKHTKEKQP